MDKTLAYIVNVEEILMNIDKDLNDRISMDLFDNYNPTTNLKNKDITTMSATTERFISPRRSIQETSIIASPTNTDPMDVCYDLNRIAIYFILNVKSPDLKTSDSIKYIDHEVDKLRGIICHSVHFLAGNS